MAVTLDQVWAMGAELPGVARSTAWGSPALKVKGRNGKLELMAGVPTHKSAEPGSLLFRMDRRERAALIEEAPELYYAPEHYVGYDAVLARVARLTPELAHDLLAMAHRFVTGKRGK